MLFNSFRLTRYLEAKEEEEAALLELPVPPLPSQSPTGKKNPKKKSSGKKIVERRDLKTGETLHRLDLHLYQNSNLPITASTPPLWGAC